MRHFDKSYQLFVLECSVFKLLKIQFFNQKIEQKSDALTLPRFRSYPQRFWQQCARALWAAALCVFPRSHHLPRVGNARAEGRRVACVLLQTRLSTFCFAFGGGGGGGRGGACACICKKPRLWRTLWCHSEAAACTSSSSSSSSGSSGLWRTPERRGARLVEPQRGGASVADTVLR